MQIYTACTGGEKALKLQKYGLGVMISSHLKTPFYDYYQNVPCALDNGAYSAWQKGFPFDEWVFLKTLSKCIEKKINLSFIVCPDLIAGGLKSLDFSMMWRNRLTCNNIALAVQDGMTINSAHHVISDKFSHIFVGGTERWKWTNARMWVDYAHENNMKCHIGQTSTAGELLMAQQMGADSCDSTTFVRNDYWHILDEFKNPIQTQILI